MTDGRGGWVLEVDIRKFFDNLDHRPPASSFSDFGCVTACCCA